MATSIEFEGNDSRNLRFNAEDKVVAGESLFDSQITMNEIDLALYYDVPFVSTLSSDRINIDLGLNVRAIDFDGKIEQDYIVNGSKNFVVPIPMVFGALTLHPMNDLALEAEGRGLSVGANKAYSVVGRIRWNVMDQVFATGGYRFDKVDVNYQGILIDANISGPFFEAGLSF
jgi:outer membrane protein